MKLHPLISFVTAMLVTAVIIVAVGIVYVFSTFNLAGGETLNEVTAQYFLVLVISMFLLFAASVIAKRNFKKNKAAAYGTIFLPSLLLIFSLFFLIKEYVFLPRFDEVVWKQSEFKPERMAKALVRNKKLIGLTRTEVKKMLGEGAEEYGINSDRGSIIYNVENEWTLRILFQNEVVVETIMKQPSMMTMSRGKATPAFSFIPVQQAIHLYPMSVHE